MIKNLKERLVLRVLTPGIFMTITGIIAGCLIVYFIGRSDIEKITTEHAEVTADLIKRNIKITMLEGKADVTKTIIKELTLIKGVEEIRVYNHQGKPAFQVVRDSLSISTDILKRLSLLDTALTEVHHEKITTYLPLRNSASCQSCHPKELALLGAVRVDFSVKELIAGLNKFIRILLLLGLLGASVLGIIFWIILKWAVIGPVKKMQDATRKLRNGDLRFEVDIKGRDEIQKMMLSIKDSLSEISTILQGVKDVTKKVSGVVRVVELNTEKIVKGTQFELGAFQNISSATEELNFSIVEIAEGIDGLAASTEETAASMEEIASTISQILEGMQEVSFSVEESASSIGQLLYAVREVAENADILARKSEEIVSTVSEVAQFVRDIENNAKKSSELSQKTFSDASTLGLTAVEKMSSGMEKIKNTVESMAQIIMRLGERSEDIGKIITVIDEITDQTNLLALNAAILAARAGEYGKGFSVVADEIKSLAERTSFSTQEISSLIKNVKREIEDAVNAIKDTQRVVYDGLELSTELKEALTRILKSSEASSEMARAIERATEEQEKAIGMIESSLEDMMRIVKSVSRATQEQSKGTNLIMKSIEKTKDVTKRVNLATDEQTKSIKQIAKAIDLISEKTQVISNAINEQKIGSAQIMNSLFGFKEIPDQNRFTSFIIQKSVKELVKNLDLLNAEMERFRLQELSKDILRFGVVPLELPSEMYRRFLPLVEYLTESIGERIELRVPLDFETAVREIGEGITKIAFMTPSTYIEAHQRYGVKVILKALRNGRPFHHSVIIVKDDSDIRVIKDLKGRTFAFGDELSTSSHIVPRAMLKENGIDGKDLKFYTFLGHHDDIALAVLRGDFDAGCVRESTAEQFKDKGLRILAISEEIPEFNICINNLSEEQEEILKDVILRLTSNENGLKILKSIDPSYTGFIEAQDADYGKIRLMMKSLEIY